MSRRKSTHVQKVDLDDAIMISSGDDQPLSVASARSRSSRSRSISAKSSVTVEEELSCGEEEEEQEQEQEQEPVQEDPVGRRRSMRHRSPNKRYTKDFVQDTPRKRGGRRRMSDSEEEEDEQEATLDSDEASQMDELAGKVKATSLFEDQEDVEGQRIFGLKTPRKRDAMRLLAASVQRTPTGTPNRRVSRLLGTPKTPKTPTTGKGKGKAEMAKTPHQVRRKLQKDIKKKVQNDSESDFSASGSDFVPSEEEDDEDEDDTQESEDQEDSSASEQEDKSKRPRIKSQFTSISIAPGRASFGPAMPSQKQPVASGQRISSRLRSRKQAELEYVLQSDEYFSTHTASKVVTSDHTLDRLNTPRLPHDQLFRLLKELRGSTEHQNAIHELHDEYESHFSKWLFLMNEGFNILLYGLGSKRNLLQSFHRKVLADKPVIVINGFFPTLTVKDVLDAITADILDLSVHSSNFHEVIDLIEEEFSYLPDTHLFLIVHNLDGTMLRNSKAQNVLARLAKIDNIHLLASIDHINTPLIWDSAKLSYYNFSWWDVTTMLPYSDETAFENSLLVQNSGALALSSMKNVFQSLTANSRGIFLAIVKYQLANKGNPHYPGMLFKDLYGACREAFLVSTDLALRAQLTEFTDHKLVRVKRTIDGAENLLIPIESGLLQQFLEENEQG